MVTRHEIFGIGVDATTYAEAAEVIVEAGKRHRSFAMTALATHGLMSATRDPEYASVIGSLDLVTPDGQPVRWALNHFHGGQLEDRVYGPDLTGHVCRLAAREDVSVYLFGSTAETCLRFERSLLTNFPGLRIAGVQPDRFREATPEEDAADVERIVESGAGVVLVGRGCPRQERWVASHKGRVPAAMMAVGAAFDYWAGTLRRPPRWMQDHALEWLWRLGCEPRRLMKRYATTNSQFIAAALAEELRTRSGRPAIQTG